MPRDARIRLILAESGRSVGGTERVVWELATRLSPERFALRVWLSPAPGVDELEDALRETGVVVERVAEVDSRWDLGGMLRSYRALRRVRPHILHVHHVWPAADRYLSEIAAWAGVPHQVVTEHIVGRSHSAPQRALKRRELKRADAVTTVCAAVADELARELGVARERFQVVPNGAGGASAEEEGPAARRWRSELGAEPRRPLIVCLGRLEDQKGQDVLLEAAAALRASGMDFVLAFAGQGSRAEALAEKARTLGLEGVTRWLGQLEDPGPLLRAADVVALPSRWEGLPLTLLEAMARGRPVVASAVGGVPEVLVDGLNGLLAPPADASALAAALGRLLRAPTECASLGSEAEETARRDYSWERVVAGFESVYDEVLGLSTFTPERARARRRSGRRAGPDASRGTAAASSGQEGS
jgi:glycosyltransferase involved in cell wall biosynthesis